MKNNLIKFIIAIFAAALALGACSKSKEAAQDGSANNSTPTAAQTSAEVDWKTLMTDSEKKLYHDCEYLTHCDGVGNMRLRVLKRASLANLAKGDANTLDAQFVELKDANQLMALYFALANSPVDYEKIANSYSEEYQKQKDAFKKQDIVTALKPKIDAEISNAKSLRYWRETIPLDLKSYDTANKSFGVNHKYDIMDRIAFNSGSGWSTATFPHSLIYTNFESYGSLVVTDEKVARQIEMLISTSSQIKAELFLYAQNAVDNEVRMQVLKMKLTDDKGNELITIKQ